MAEHRNQPDFEDSLRAAVDDVVDSVQLVVDAVVGHGAHLVAHVLQRVDRLVDDVVADAAAVAREAEALFAATCVSQDDEAPRGKSAGR
jgi:hypothetical protein